MSETRKILIWDLPTRLFHWLLVLAIVALVVTGKAGGSWMEWHGRLGLLVLGLLVFRLLWGVMGSTYARFAGFFPTPAKVAAYLRGQWHAPGHNPLGACSVLALLAVPPQVLAEAEPICAFSYIRKRRFRRPTSMDPSTLARLSTAATLPGHRPGRMSSSRKGRTIVGIVIRQDKF